MYFVQQTIEYDNLVHIFFILILKCINIVPSFLCISTNLRFLLEIRIPINTRKRRL